MKWLFLGLLFPAFAARAQTAAVGQKIEYRRDLPKSVARLMPRGAKSLFWGRFTPKVGRAPMALHLYDLFPSRGGVSRRYLGLDLFAFPYTRAINRVVIDFVPSASGALAAPFVALNLYGLKKLESRQPVLKIRCFDPDGFVGSAGDEVIVVFPKGWQGKAISKAWPWGASNAPNALYQENVLRYDSKGHLQLNTEIAGAPESGAPPKGTYGLFQWNGRQFEAK